MSQSIPSELSDFLTRYIDSIAQLEALLLMRRSPEIAWSTEKAAGRLYVSEREAGEALAHLAASGLLTRQGGEYTYSPQSPELARTVDLLEQHYKRQLIPITNLIHAKPRRVRQFADAFKLKKE